MEAGEIGDAFSDVASDFGSTASGFSQSSGRSRSSARSSKNRRKQERNKYSLREGSRFEEEGLLQALHQLYTHCFAYADEVQSLLCHLTLFRRDALAKQLQDLYNSLCFTLTRNSTKIWVLPESAFPGSGPQSTVNSILSSRVSGDRDSVRLSDLQVFIPPKVNAKPDSGMHLHLPR